MRIIHIYETHMITVNLKGGLGNQMFQYARARARAKNAQIALNVYELEHPALGDTPRSFALGDFALGPYTIVRKPRTLIHKMRDRIVRTLQPDWGYFQSEHYFVSEAVRIRSEFSLRTTLTEDASLISTKIQNTPSSVSLHVRRGDYVKNPEVLRDFGICSLQYYEQAIAHIRKEKPDAHFFVFSDDIPWVREHLLVGNNATFVEGKGLTDKIELVLMSQCAHNIIANSSFSWWGAWLNANPEKIVVAPTPWFDRAPYNPDIIPKSWIQISK